MFADDVGLWSQSSKIFSSRNCWVLNFGWRSVQSIEYPQMMMNLNEETKINFKQMWTESPGNCFMVLVGSEYFQAVDQIEKRVEEIHEELNIVKIDKFFFFEQMHKDVLPVTNNSKKPKVWTLIRRF